MFLKSFFIFVGTIFTISTVQWLCMIFLNKFCHFPTPWGLVTNLFTLGSPICVFINNVQTFLMNHYMLLWTGASATLIGVFLKYLK